MKIYQEGDKSRAICEADGLVTTTFAVRTVPFRDGSGSVEDILVAVCDVCGAVVATPPQSTPSIQAAHDRATISVEANLPLAYTDALDLAAYRIDPALTTGFRKPLLLYYISRYAAEDALMARLAESLPETRTLFSRAEQGKTRRRLSMKINASTSNRLTRIMDATALSKTDVLKSVIGQIHRDIVLPDKPKDMKTLKILASIAS